MRRVALIIPHYKTFRLTAACLYAFKKYGFPIEHEIVVCDNSVGHPSIKVLTETELGEGIKIVPGRPNFQSHGEAYQQAYLASDSDWIFTSETDSFPTRHGWGEGYVKASADYDFMGPETPMGGGTYLHPAGAMVSRNVIEAAESWQKAHSQWVFIPGAGAKLKTSDKGHHVVAHEDWLNDMPLVDQSMRDEIELWRHVGVWQEMRCFDEDTFENYPQRKGIVNWEPQAGKVFYNKIGFEPGQWLSYFASQNFKALKLPVEIKWMQGMIGQQAEYSDIFGGAFRHLWAGSVVEVSAKDMHPRVVDFKKKQKDELFSQLPESLQKKVIKIEEENL